MLQEAVQRKEEKHKKAHGSHILEDFPEKYFLNNIDGQNLVTWAHVAARKTWWYNLMDKHITKLNIFPYLSMGEDVLHSFYSVLNIIFSFLLKFFKKSSFL